LRTNSLVAEQMMRPEAKSRTELWVRKGVIAISASIFMALCAHVSVPLVFSPVPITLQPFGVLIIGLLLGSRMGFAALALYLAEGAAGLPVFSPAGPGGILQLLGPTGGFLMASPAASFIAGRLFEKRSDLSGALLGCIAAEFALFSGGLSWFLIVTQVSFASALNMAVLPYLPGEVLKVAAGTGIAMRWRHARIR
jgi:biotin transport system substrate-specific component